MMPALIWRLLEEERFLGANLPGYSDYSREVRWRLLPGIF
jgi:protein-S-isoprenylcysteine O-methyltransferase Ste14